MAKTILNDEGQEEIVFSQAEIDAQFAEKEAALKAAHEAAMAEKDAHVKEKLGQFQQATKSAEQLHEEAMAGIAEAKRIAEEAKGSVALAKESELTTKRDFYIQSISGGDVDLTKKLEDAYGIINLPATNDKEILERLQKAVSIAGVTHTSTPNLSFGGSTPPNFQPSNEATKAAAHEAWKKEFGISI